MKKIALILILALMLNVVQPLVFALPNGDVSDVIDDADGTDDVVVSDDVDEADYVYVVEDVEDIEDADDVDEEVGMKTAFKVMETAEISSDARESLRRIVAERDIVALVFLVDYYTVRATASFDGNPVADVPSGHQVNILDVVIGDYNTLWARVSFYNRGVSFEGFIERGNLATPDSRFLDWEIEYDIESLTTVGAPRAFAPFSMAAASLPPDIAAFPPSYHQPLLALRAAHPNWQFVAHNTGIDWNAMVRFQMSPGRALVHNSQPTHMWTQPSFEPGWFQATEIALRHFLDPRNWLNTPHIFMFELLSFNQTAHSVAATQLILNNTFMRGNIGHNINGVARPGAVSNMTYAQAFHNIGRELNVSPFHLASRVRQEQGVNGSTHSISGTHATFRHVFNYFNWGASPPNAIFNGLQRANSLGWNTRFASLRGGADQISRNYIRNVNGAQNTLYLQKFNAARGVPHHHQFMTNIMAPRSESVNVFNAYSGAGLLGNPFVFRIPVYNNMPAAASGFTPSHEIVLAAPAGYTADNTRFFLDGREHFPTFNHGHFSYNPRNGSVRTATMHLYDANNIPVGMFAWALSFDGISYVVTPLPQLQNLLTYHGFSVRIVGNSGIRFHTGIAINHRNALLSTGVHGFTLREYGTVAMHNSNNDRFPLVLGGQGTVSGRSFGQGVDVLFAIQGGRGIFTSVMVDIPSEQYKTNFLFRGYAILRRNGVDHIFYGPQVASSIYTVADHVIQTGHFPLDSPEDLFLRRILEEAG